MHGRCRRVSPMFQSPVKITNVMVAGPISEIGKSTRWQVGIIVD
jgi:hypothetical protein